MRKRIFLIVSVILLSILVAGCGNSAKTVQNEKKESSPAPKEASSRLSEAERKTIFKAMMTEYDKADGEAEERFPTYSDPDAPEENNQKNQDLANQLSEKYMAPVLAKYEISLDDEVAIVNEGLANEWPSPY